MIQKCMEVHQYHSNITQKKHGASRNYRYVLDVSAAPHHHLLYLLLSYCCLYQKPLKSYLSVLAVFPRPKSLINTFRSSLGSTLLLIENAAIDPLRLWVIKYCFLAPLPGIIALLVSEAGKE